MWWRKKEDNDEEGGACDSNLSKKFELGVEWGELRFDIQGACPETRENK